MRNAGDPSPTRGSEPRRTSAETAATRDEVDRTLRNMFRFLERDYGPQDWWPVQGRLGSAVDPPDADAAATEIVVGAILTQNTSWKNVERAIARLLQAEKLSWPALRDLPETELAERIRPAGTYRVKARRIKAFVEHLWRRHGGSLRSLLTGPLESVRSELLSVPGIGRETADAILLYAAGKPSFVVDAYTIRILRRHGLIRGKGAYEDVRRMFHTAMPPDVRVYNEYHALLVAVGKTHCRRRARCAGCPLESLPHDPFAA